MLRAFACVPLWAVLTAGCAETVEPAECQGFDRELDCERCCVNAGYEDGFGLFTTDGRCGCLVNDDGETAQ